MPSFSPLTSVYRRTLISPSILPLYLSRPLKDLPLPSGRPFMKMSYFSNPQNYEDCVNRLRNLTARVEAVNEASRSTLSTRRLPDRETGDTLALQRLAERRDRSPWSTRSGGRRPLVPGNIQNCQRQDAFGNASHWRDEYFLTARERDTARHERDTAREQRDVARTRLEIVTESLQHLQNSIELLQGHSRRLGDDLRTSGNVESVGNVEATPPRPRSATLTPAASVSDGQDFPETG